MASRGSHCTFAHPAALPSMVDILVVNQGLHRMLHPRAEAFLVRGGRFAGVGTTPAMKSLAGPRAQTFDAKGMTIVPGFIDCHNHPIGTTLLYEVLVGNPFEVEFVTIASIVDKLKARAKQLPAGTWVEGYFHDDTKLKDKRSIHARSRPGVHRASGRGESPRRATRRSTTARRSSWRRSPTTRRTRMAAPSIAIRTASTTAAPPIWRATCSIASARGRHSLPKSAPRENGMAWRTSRKSSCAMG
jgi:hypothetical protein